MDTWAWVTGLGVPFGGGAYYGAIVTPLPVTFFMLTVPVFWYTGAVVLCQESPGTNHAVGITG